jgi:hypothetical protein
MEAVLPMLLRPLMIGRLANLQHGGLLVLALALVLVLIHVLYLVDWCVGHDGGNRTQNNTAAGVDWISICMPPPHGIMQ